MNKKIFKFEIWYFKPSGKFYTEVTVEWKVRATDTGLANMNDAAAKLRGLRNNGGPGAMPGLSGDGWPGLMVINCSEGFPCLLMPEESA